MTRRLFLLSPAAAIAAERVSTSKLRNDFCTSANEFHGPYAHWADVMNESKEADVISAKAIEAWDPLPQAWRRVEHACKNWLQSWRS